MLGGGHFQSQGAEQGEGEEVWIELKTINSRIKSFWLSEGSGRASMQSKMIAWVSKASLER